MITQINERDLISMKLLHYFITKKNYNPVVVQGVENEIWLENLDAPTYKIVRIVNNYIHNDEQLDFDVFKTKRMVKKIKRKTFTFNIKTLSILTDIGENVSRDKTFDNVDIIFYENESKLIESNFIKENFQDLKDNLNYSEEGFQLFLKITNEINQKNKKNAEETDSIFEPKVPIITYTLMGIIGLVYLLSFFVKSDELILYLGLQSDLVRYGEVYRLITCGFLHVDVVHILTNLYSLYIVGKLVESYFGKKKVSFNLFCKSYNVKFIIYFNE
jgi:membrane associated rhomboid family serine protease